MPRRLIMLAALAAFLLALPAGALAATKPVPVNLAGVTFNGKENGEPTDEHKPIVFKPTKKGKYVFYCAPHKALGMVLTLTVK